LELAIDSVNLESVEISSWLSATIEPFIHRADVSQQKLITSLSDWLPTVTTDRICLTKIFVELLNNACKYTQVGGGILVDLHGDPNSEWLTIEIENQAAISAQHLPQIFEQFYRIPGSNRSQQGSGLGLSLVQKLVQQLNGEIKVSSSKGWTKFVLQLPIRSA
jgi:signal transduction histidine kinase